jgi:cytochrome c peroxidase
MKTKISLSALIIIFLTVLIISCKKTDRSSNENNSFLSEPTLPSQTYDYKKSSNDEMASLGRVLFYDKNLSLNNSVSCASCHQQIKAFCDNQQFSTGVEDLKTSRNTPSIFAKQSRVFWDGRAMSMFDLALRPVKNHVEMKLENLQDLVDKLSKLEYYPELFNKATGSSKIDTFTIATALSEFLRNFDFSANKFTKSRLNKAILNTTETLGESVFFGKARCSQCHHIESNSNFPGDTINIGGYGFTNESHNIGLNTSYVDNGIGELTHSTDLNGMFMIPALLNVEYTAPYMHDGRFKTLEEVVEHYNSGIQNHPNLDIILRDIGNVEEMEDGELLIKFDKNKNGFIEPFEIAGIPPVKLNLSASEKKGLVAFLKTLSDPNIFVDQKFSNPFQAN